MLFNSPIFLFAFLPIVFSGYYLLHRLGSRNGGRVWLVLASLLFYGYWNPVYLLLMIPSIVVNFLTGERLQRLRRADPSGHGTGIRRLLAAGVTLNLGLLAYFKYSDFFIANLNWAAGTQLPLLHLTLPLAISFFTFTQIAYLVDCYRKELHEYDFLNYALFVTFFPHLIAGPIIHHGEMMPQFASRRSGVINWRNITVGLCLFSVGLLKKVAVADPLSTWANDGFANAARLTLLDGWATSLSYTLQLYFDFSGYCDMANGAALLFNIRLPVNFNSPYKAADIQDFWRRWHMTLSRWLRDYLYISLGGNRDGRLRTLLNVFLTFLLGGLWHGAAWTFVIWGALHGLAVAVHRVWQWTGLRLPRAAGWAVTMLFVIVAWVFFRARTVADAVQVLRAMGGLNGVVLPYQISPALARLGLGHAPLGNLVVIDIPRLVAYLVIFSSVALLLPNAVALFGFAERRRLRIAHALIGAGGFAASLLFLGAPSEFLYFDF
jgi:D-alanyl-lipoteichoic acid acyltransferase DltB (MBOAT superfamily)